MQQNLIEMKVKYSRSRHNTRPVSRRRREQDGGGKQDGNVVSKSMRTIAQIMTSRPFEVSVTPETSPS